MNKIIHIIQIRFQKKISFQKQKPIRFSEKRLIRFHELLSRVYVRAIYSSKTRKHPAYPAYLAIIPHLRPFIPHPNLH